MDTLKGRIAAMFAMAACCFTAMAVALGVVAISSTLLIGGLAVAIAATCVLFMVVMMGGHGHAHGAHGHGDHSSEADDESPAEQYDKVS